MSSMPALASATPLPSSNGARLVAADGRELPLRHVQLDADAAGGLATTIVRQTFANPFAEPLAVTYQLPLPADGAVVDFAFTLGDRRITGRVEKRADARAAFEQAVIEGRTAALLEQDRSSLFHQELGNVPPGVEITCEITVEHLLAWLGDGWEWRFPTVVAPRFLGTPGQTRDAARVTTEVLDGEAPVRCGLALRIGDARTGPATSPSHAIDPAAVVGLGADARLDRDVVVRWPVATPAVGAAIEVARPGDGTAFALVTVVPPAAAVRPEPIARDLIVLLDVSGSMGGRPMEQLKAFSRALIKTLGPRDQLELIAFASQAERWRVGATAMDPRAQADALRWLEGLRAGGGTYMHDAIVEALSPLRPTSQRQVVLVSDGLIGFEEHVIGAIRTKLPASSRVHAVGVGSGVNRSLTGPMARAGAGIEVVVGLDEPVEPAVARLLARTDAPLVVDLAIRGAALREVAPARMPDLFAGAPARLALAVDPAGGTITLSGRTAAGPWSAELAVPAVELGAGRRVVATRFARERVEDLELEATAGAAVDAAIEALGLTHRIATRLTSWVAATDEATVDPGDPTRAVTVPQQLPYGMSAEGVGLRGPQLFFAAQAAPAPSGMPMRMAMPASAPPPPRQRMEQPKSKRAGPSLVGRAIDALLNLGGGGPQNYDDDEADASIALPEREEAVPVGPMPIARLRSQLDGKLVIELEVDGAWDAGESVAIELHDGSVHAAKVLAGTTRAGAVAAGQTVRLVLAWDGARPLRITVAGRTWEVR